MAKFSLKPSMPAMPANPQRMSVSVEKIHNGFLAHHSSTNSKGNYTDKTVYHPSRPKFTLKAAANSGPNFQMNPRVPVY